MLEERRQAYSQLSTRLAYLDDAELRALIGTDAGQDRGWGASQPTELDGVPIFIKRVPLTELEQRHPFSTRNHFRLPTYYCYGVGSAGFGAFRELATHVKTTNWVLEGAIKNFPMLLHSRVLPRKAGGSRQFDLDGYGAYWGGSKNIVRYIEARNAAPDEVWLVLEHVPHMLATWLVHNQHAVDDLVDQMCETISFLRANGVVHFDAHAWNILTDGAVAYLADYGLVLDGAFHLSTRERDFLDHHSHYDYGEAVASVTTATLYAAFEQLAPGAQEDFARKYAADPRAGTAPFVLAVVDQIEKIDAEGDLPLERGYVDTLLRYRDITTFFWEFIARLRADRRKKTVWDDAALARLVRDAGLLPRSSK